MSRHWISTRKTRLPKKRSLVWISIFRVELTQCLNLALKKSISQRNIGMGLGLGLLDLDTMDLDLSSAGMPFPYYFRKAEGRLEPVPLRCPPMGFWKHLPVQQKKIHLNRGDAILFLSDGFAERIDPEDAYWGEPALRRELGKICVQATKARDMAEGLLEACDRFARGREHDDDMTVLALRVK